MMLVLVLLVFLMIVVSLFTAWKQLKYKNVTEKISEQKPEDKNVFMSLEKDFYSKPSNGLRTLAASLCGISLLIFMGLLPFITGGHSRYHSSSEMPPFLKDSAVFIFSLTAIVFALLWRREYTFTENRNIQTSENFPSKLLRFFLRNSRISGLLSLVLIFTTYDLIVFDITDNGFIIMALLIYAYVFFLLAIVKKKPAQA